MPPNRRPILILGGTPEARALALTLEARRPGPVWYSLAGVAETTGPVPRLTRSGGFGGPQGFSRFLAEQGIGVVIDATHPYAAVMPQTAAEICAARGLPRLRFVRPAWMPEKGDRWITVRDAAEAASWVRAAKLSAMFLAAGPRESETLALQLPETQCFARVLSNGAAPRGCEVIVAKPPYTQIGDRALLGRIGAKAVYAKNAGGMGAYGKIAAARDLGLPVILLSRPESPPGPLVDNRDAAQAWLAGLGQT
ncbi:MAG: precorrin-6A/cobalt-precorrin-6A reductase [Rhodospirillaceae bacterium]